MEWPMSVESHGASRASWYIRRMMNVVRRDGVGPAMLALVPLAVIAIGFFVPPILLSHSRLPVMSPYAEGGSLFGALHAAAAVLAGVTIACRVRGRAPAGPALWLAVVATIAAGYVPALLLYYTVTEAPALAVGAAATVIVALGFGRIALRRDGWRRWMALLGAYAVLALPYGCPIIAGAFNEWSGGVTFVAAEVTLLVLVVRALGERAISPR